jgi:hypothetical protein
MVTTLASIVENDVPFLLEERKTRISELKVLLVQSNISTSENLEEF